jgi:hypothetical protein
MEVQESKQAMIPLFFGLSTSDGIEWEKSFIDPETLELFLQFDQLGICG